MNALPKTTFLQHTFLKPEEFKLTGFIARDTFMDTCQNHFATLEGKVVCGSKAKYGMDCHTEIRIATYEHFEMDAQIRFGDKDKFNLRKNHLPMECFIGCKKCQKKIKQMLQEIEKQLTMPKIKLSPKQKEVITRMRAGEKLHYLNSINARCFFGHEKDVSWATISKLEKLKLTDRIDRFCVLTELGKTIEL